ncbi:MAG: hypothetical protein KDC32_20285, partial [Saprospiraceae bacterium]|nr:hypothetical protein [Saprospiraceae bacterium]
VDQIVTYTVTPTSEADGCDGMTFEVEITVKSEPVGADPEPMTCSDVPLNIVLQSLITNGMAGVTFSWSAADNPNVTGETTGTSTAGTITDVLTNVSGGDQIVVYTVTPTGANGCEGDAFTVTVTVKAEPTVDPSPNSACIGVPTTIFGNPSPGSAPVVAYKWTLQSSSVVGPFSINGTPIFGAAGQMFLTENINITFPFGNPSAGLLAFTYQVEDANGCFSDIDVHTVTFVTQPNSGTANAPYNNPAHPGADFCSDFGAINLPSLLSGEDAGGVFMLVSGGGTVVGDTYNPVGIDGPGITQVVISYTVTAMAPCPGSATTLLYLNIQPTPDAGIPNPVANNDVCTDTDAFNLFDLIQNYDTGGTWSEITLSGGPLNPVTGIYDPSNVAGGSYQFSYTVFPMAPCANPDVVTVQVNVSEKATADAGPDQTICFSGTATLAGSFGGTAASATWSNYAPGTISDPNDPNAIFTPDASQYGTTVTLIWTTNDPDGVNFPCPPAVDEVDIIVEPIPMAEAQDDDGNGDPVAETVCNGAAPLTTIDVTVIDGNDYLISNITAGANISGVTRTAGDTPADGDQLEPGALTNANTTMSETVVYEITPYTYGPNGMNDDGLGDDCLGTPFTVTITVEPTPAAMAIDDDGNGNANTETICNGDVPLTTVDVTALDGNNYLISNVTAGPNISGGITAPGDTKADGAAIETGNLTNANPTMSETVIYEITPYTYGQNETDDNGTGDDCLG